MNKLHLPLIVVVGAFLWFAVSPVPLSAQQPQGPQSDAPPAVAPKPVPAPQAGSGEKVIVPAGTRVGVVLQNGISTRSARPGDSVYLQTSFPITIDNRIVIPVGSYLRGELIESKRPGRVKGRGEFRMRLNTLILPTGYTVDLNAAPRSADSGGKETMDSEGKITGGSDKGNDVGTVAGPWRGRRPRRRASDARPRSRTASRLHDGCGFRTRPYARWQPDSVHQSRPVPARRAAAGPPAGRAALLIPLLASRLHRARFVFGLGPAGSGCAAPHSVL